MTVTPMQPIALDKHPPERRRKAVTTVNCGCSCCCCCCLHTLGSLVGAAVAPAIGTGRPLSMTHYYDEETGKEYRLVNNPALSATSFFWWMLCFLMFLGFTFGLVTTQGDGGSLVISGIVLLMIFPGLQLATLLITLIVYVCWPRPDKLVQLQQLAKIALGVVLGTLAGILAMFGIAGMFGLFR